MSTLTPEGKVKRAIGALLRSYPGIYYVMPVPGGYGASTLDYLGICAGRGFGIEAKRPGGKPSMRQLGIIENIERAGGRVFVIDGPAGLADLEGWIKQCL